MGVVVQKYGGTSVGNVERIKNVAKRIKKTTEEGNQVIVVVSAMGDTTDDLVSLMYDVTKNPPDREMDMILTTGEQISIALLSAALQEVDIPSISYTGWQAGIELEPEFGNAKILDIHPEKLHQSLTEGKVVIVAGFQGITETDEIATLGRGGSDTSAVAVAAAVRADYCEINTDVAGIYTTDPRIVKEARKLPAISHDEMLEMATLGASVLHPRAVELAKVHGMKMLVRSSFSEEKGTYIREAKDMEQEEVVSGVAYDTDVIKVEILKMPNTVGTVSKLFGYLAAENINVDMIVLSEHGSDTFDLAFSISIQDQNRTMETLKKHQDELQFTDALYEEGVAKVSIIGSGMSIHPGVAAKMFETLTASNIRIKMISTSEIKVSCIVPEEKGKEAVQMIHSNFGLDTEREVGINT